MSRLLRTAVRNEHGQWIVEMVLLDEHGAERRRVSAYRTQALAQVAAASIERAASRRQRPAPDEEIPTHDGE